MYQLFLLLKINRQTYRQTDRHTYTLIAILCPPAAVEIKTKNMEKN